MEEEKRARRDEKPFGPDSGLEPPTKPIDQADLSEDRESRELPPETICPGCGRFVGAYEKCPYCGATLKKRMSLIIWKRIAVGGTILGLFLMWLAATRMKPKEIQIGDIREGYNNANVTITGVVTGRQLKKQKNDFNITVADRSGSIRAQNFGDLNKFREAGSVPRVGDEVKVTGTVQVNASWGTSLFLNAPHEVEILERKEAEEVAISAITDSWANSRAIVTGTVKYPPRFGKVVISDGVSELTIFLDEKNLGKDIPEFKVGEGVRVTGVLVLEDEGFAIVPGEAGDIETGTAYSLEIPRKKIKDITRDDLQKLVEVEGKVVGFKPFRGGGGAVRISDGTGSIEVGPLFVRIFDKIPRSHLLRTTGTLVRARGTVGEYRGDLQVQPGSPENVTVLFSDKIDSDKK